MAAPLPRSVSFELDLPDIGATAALARAVAACVRTGDVIALGGDLGAGKTTFARAFINALPPLPDGAPGEEVPSPTFTLLQVYERAPAAVWHFDLYRLERPEEVYELGFEEALTEGIPLIEWPERLGSLLPDERLDLRLTFVEDPEARRVAVTGHGTWAQRCEGLHEFG